MKKAMIYSLVVACLSLGMAKVSLAQKDQLEKTWYTAENSSKVEMYLTTNGTYAGKIIWLKEPTDKETGKPILDKKNPDDKLESAPVLGMVIMRGFKKDKDNPNEYTDGTIYDPKNGKTYCGKITMKGNTLDMRGFLCSLHFLGRTETWTLAE